MDLGVTMPPEVLEDKLSEGRRQATWNTKRPPTRLTPGWTNRLFVACGGCWRGYFPLSGDVLWNPEDEAAPVAMIFDASRWREIQPAVAPRFRGWRYLETPPDGGREKAADSRSEPGTKAPSSTP